MPAAQEVIESRRSHCFFTMSSSNRWTRTSAAEAKAKASSSNRRQEFHNSHYDDDKRHSSPPGGYAPRRHEELPPRSQRTRDTVPYEDHMAFSNGFRYETEWFQAHEGVRQKRARGMHSLMGPNNMSGFDRHQMCMDVISWILEGDSKKREYDEALHWLADFGISWVSQHKKRKGGLILSAIASMLTSLEIGETATSLVAARPCQEFLDTVETLISSVPVEA